jgi:hypothetical protein
MDLVKTKSEYNGYMGEYMLSRYHALMAEARESLGGKCVACGITDELEFDHIDPATKSFAISHGWSSKPDIFWAEVRKCQLLCKPHHLEKSEEQSVGHGQGLTGKRNCLCDKCRPLKNAYNRAQDAKRRAERAAKKAPVAQLV